MGCIFSFWNILMSQQHIRGDSKSVILTVYVLKTSKNEHSFWNSILRLGHVSSSRYSTQELCELLVKQNSSVTLLTRSVELGWRMRGRGREYRKGVCFYLWEIISKVKKCEKKTSLPPFWIIKEDLRFNPRLDLIYFFFFILFPM